MKEIGELQTPERILLGPGPSCVSARVYKALAQPMIGHLDPQFLALMTDVQELLRFVFQTENRLTFPVSGTGSAGMETALCNFIEPGDPVLICVNGYFADRMAEISARYGAEVRRLERPWGEAFAAEDIEAELRRKPAKIVAIVHGETSTGVLQPMEGIADIVHRYGGLLAVDCVATLGGIPVTADAWQADMVYSGSQKCLSAPPGLAPFTASPRAEQVLARRETKVGNWYLDLSSINAYWGKSRTYHHTAPISLNFALREALRAVHEEGLEARFARHLRHAQLLWEGLPEIGLKPVIPLEFRMPVVTTVWIPEGVDDMAIRRRLLDEYNIEIAGGLGAFKGRVWRIGLMGHSSQRQNVVMLLGALARILH